MVFGGIPYYLDRLRNDQTVTENIDRLFFDDEKIHQEFKDVYAGLYSSKGKYISVVKVIGSQFYGMTQADISTATDTKTGGTLSKILKNLLESGVSGSTRNTEGIELRMCTSLLTSSLSSI